MPSSVQLTLPNATQVVVQSFANASNAQLVTIAIDGQQPVRFTGTGFYDTQIGGTVVNTPAGEGGIAVTVTVEHSTDGGQSWQPSEVEWSDCLIGYYQLFVVASEDSADDTWDDATTYFSWPSLPDDAVPPAAA